MFFWGICKPPYSELMFHSSNATYDTLLGSNKPFPQRIPLRVWFSEPCSSSTDILVRKMQATNTDTFFWTQSFIDQFLKITKTWRFHFHILFNDSVSWFRHFKQMKPNCRTFVRTSVIKSVSSSLAFFLKSHPFPEHITNCLYYMLW